MHLSDSASTSEPRRRGRRTAGALALAALLAAGPAAASTAVETAPPVPAGLEEFYAQTLAWTPCGAAAECALMRVPLDYDAPAGAEITLALKRVAGPAAAAPQEPLLVNFGGPGGSGTASVEPWAQGLDPAVLAAYDVVGFDPRGVGASTAVECVDDATMDAMRATPIDPDTAAGLAALTTLAEQFAAGCRAGTGALLGEVDTLSAARDLDVLRAVLGDEDLDYLGYSYGTELGAVYADLFPENTGRFVLDAAVDPTLDYAQESIDQAGGFERAIRVYAASCLPQDGCPLEGTVDEAVAQIGALIDGIAAEPLPTADGRPLTVDDAVSAIILPLYEERAWWRLTSALVPALERGDGTGLMALADLAYGRGPGGKYISNSREAHRAIDCLDTPANTDPAAMAAADARLQEVSPTFGDYFSHGEVFCGALVDEPVPPREPVQAQGAAPILVIGGTGDTATPYAWAEALADQLETARLLTRVGEGHGSYLRANECIDATVDEFLLRGTLPAEGAVC
ncbi:alpha/beta hydrolase [Kocuria rosea]|uniref:alpha/beta hydrolase n=1 Tax=Kocuria rosea TaxID=1275 RepID=UPI0020408325|nr:alpha/beta hydrolase [Kocuria rosea]MCM3687016.1 alpha/beta hydrolase [Kocuria rosea]